MSLLIVGVVLLALVGLAALAKDEGRVGEPHLPSRPPRDLAS